MQNIFETERLILRHINPDTDFEPWAEISADPAAMRFLGGAVMDHALARRNMAMVIDHQHIRGSSFFCSRKGKQCVGWPCRALEPRRMAHSPRPYT